jgi:hypothetical protein
MEDVYPRVATTDQPAVHVMQFGSGRVVYFPWDIDRTFWEVLSTDHLALLRNAVDWVTNEPRPVEVSGPGMIDVTVWRQHGSMTVHLVNLTNPMMMKGPVREVIPLPGQMVRIPSLPGAKVAGVKLLVSGRPSDFRAVGQSIELALPPIGLHEVIAIDFA